MSRVSSLGLHTPSALPYCITEKLLPDAPTADQYTWTTGLPHEELLVTGSAVIWSQGGVIRRVFRYNVEKEPVVQALLTWFPSEAQPDLIATDDNDDEDTDRAGYISGGSEGNKRKPEWADDAQAKKRVSKWTGKSKTYAQLGGGGKTRTVGGKTTSRRNTEVGSAPTAEDDAELPDRPIGRARALVVFLKSQGFVYFLSGTMHILHLPFEIQAAMAAPCGLVLQRRIPPPQPPPSVLNAFSLRPPVITKDTPRLFTLTDPLSEVGLVMNTANAPCTEDLLYISSSSELSSMEAEPSRSGRPSSTPEVIFAVTHNQDQQQVTVWQVRYIPQEPPASKSRRVTSASGTASRRRSSFGPGTGASTPVAGGGPGSISIAQAKKAGRDSLVPSEAASFVSLDDDFDTGRRRSSRRVSSMVARADLSINHDAGQRFSDMAGSIGASFAAPPPPPPNSMAIEEQPVDELLNELNMGNLGLGIDDFGAYNGEGLRQEMLMHKIESFHWTSSETPSIGPNGSARVFTIPAPSSVDAAAAARKESGGRSFALFIVNRKDYSMLELTFRIQLHSTGPTGYARRSSTRYGGASAMGYTPVLTQTTKRDDIQDAIKIQDSTIQKVLILTDDNKFELYSPWGGNMGIVLPLTLSRWNPNMVGEDGSRRGSRKKGFAKTLSTTPDTYHRLAYSEPGGRVTVVDGDDVSHRISIKLSPKDVAVKACLETLRVVLGAYSGSAVGEGIYSLWMMVSRWLLVTAAPDAGLSKDSKGTAPADEWKAFVVTLFLLAIPHLPEIKPRSRRQSAFVKSQSVMAQREWEDLVSHEGEWGSGPEYLRSSAWSWMEDEEDARLVKKLESPRKTHGSSENEGRLLNRFITDCVLDARNFLKSPWAEDIQTEFYNRTDNQDKLRKTGLPVALVALHLLREEWKLDIAMENHMRKLCPVLRQIASWLDWGAWAAEYMLENVDMVGWAYDNGCITANDVPGEPFNPPDIFTWLTDCLKGVAPLPFMVLQDIIDPSDFTPNASQRSQTPRRGRNPFSPPPPPSPATLQKPVFAKITPRTRIITSLYTILATPGMSEVDVVEKMVELRMTVASLQRLPEGVGIPIREAIAKCQEQPPTKWGVAALDIVGRKDLKLLVDPGRARKERGTKWQSAPTHEAMRDVHTITGSTWDSEQISAFDHMAEHDRQSVSRLLFKDDRRLFEAGKLLQPNRPSIAKCIPEPQWNEVETFDHYKEVASQAATRALAIPPGRGMFNFSARIPLLTERFPISGFNLSTIIRPSGTTVSTDKTSFTEEKICWAFFHSGVSAALSISRNAKEIDTSWIVFNRPSNDLTNRHAGFLLGLGLNGHLRNIAKWHAFNYLTPKHTMTSIGLLLGLSASYYGTMDTIVTKLLSVHVTRLLPAGSAELNLSNLTQTAGIMGVGLLYAHTQHRRMSEVMLSEMEFVEVSDPHVPTDSLRDEGYRLAAGFALGFINLGSGNDMRGLHDMHLVERLLALAVGSKKVSIVHILDRATAGATIALALIYMKTNDAGLAKKIDVPETMHLLDNVRPDLFLLRTVAANLIMWNAIRGTFEWIRSRLRPFHRDRYKLNTVRRLDSEDLPLYNIIAGLCMSIALRFAGSHDIGLRDVLIHYLDEFTRLSSLPAVNHDQLLTRTTLRQCVSTVALSTAMVMSGTGDIPTFRRLRRLHARLESVPYGSHLASHLAIGALFIGNGSFTFGTSSTAIAALLAAFYPLWPSSPLDNRAHLQALRHLWVLAVENRCLIPRDVDTFRPTSIPITITLKSGEELKRTAPCLLPDLSTISTVTTTSPQHWTVVLDLANSAAHREAFSKSQSLYVAKRSAHASQSTVFQATLQALEEREENTAALEWLVGLPAFDGLERSEKALLVGKQVGMGECVDERMELEKGLREGRDRTRLRGVQMVTVDTKGEEGGCEMGIWLGEEVREGLRAGVWVRGGG